MERRSEGPQTPYETYCYHCHATFAAETKRCVHCGRRLDGRAARAVEAVTGGPDVVEDVAEPGIRRRLGGMSLWVLIALAAALARMCGGSP